MADKTQEQVEPPADEAGDTNAHIGVDTVSLYMSMSAEDFFKENEESKKSISLSAVEDAVEKSG